MHERCLQFIWDNYDSDFTLLLDFKEKSAHQKYNNYFIIEVYKYFNDSSRDIVKDDL